MGKILCNGEVIKYRGIKGKYGLRRVAEYFKEKYWQDTLAGKPILYHDDKENESGTLLRGGVAGLWTAFSMLTQEEYDAIQKACPTIDLTNMTPEEKEIMRTNPGRYV